MKPPAFAAFALMLFLLSGCASRQPATPEWISGDSAQYSNERYLTGHGQAATQEEARDRARADLAKIFQVSVAADSEDIQKFKAGQGGQGQYESEAKRRVATHTSQIVSGIQIAGMWQDPATKNHYALAVLPRLQTAARLRQQIDQLDEATGNHIEQSRRHNDLFLKISAANQAVEAQQARASLQKSLQVVDSTGRGTESKWNLAKLDSDLDGLLKRVRIGSQVAPDSPPGFTEILGGALAKAGFLIETGQNPDFVLRARMDMDDLGLQEGWYWQRGTVEVTLSEAGAGRVRGTKRWNIKVSAPDRDSAAKRALNQSDTILKQELRGAIIDMAIGR